MDNELVVEKSWWKRNWKWFLPTSISILLTFFVLILNSGADTNMADTAKAYLDNSLYEKAFEKAKINEKVTKYLGVLEP